MLAFLRACNACKRGAPNEFERHGGETVQSSSQHEIKLSTIMSPFCSFGYAFDDRISSYLRPRPYRPFRCRYSLGSIRLRMQIRDALRSDSEEQSTLCVAPWPIDNLAAFSDVRKPRFGFFVKPFRASFAFRMPTPPPPPPPPPPRTTRSPLYLMSDKISAV